jgi:ribonuclease HI
MALTREQAELALKYGWSKDLLIQLNSYLGPINKITHQTPFFMVIENQFHIYKTLGVRPVSKNSSVDEATGWGDGSGTNSRHTCGVGVVIESPYFNEPQLIHHNCGNGSNNFAELMAIFRILMEIPNNQANLTIRSDSTYSIGIITEPSWTVKANPDLVNAIREDLSFRPNVTIKHVKGHDGAYYQEMADALAGVARKYAPQTLFF